MADQQPRQGSLLFYLVLIGIALVLFWVLFTGGPRLEEVSYSDFLEAVETRVVAEARIGETKIEWRHKADDQWFVTTRVPGLDETALVRQLQEGGAKVVGLEAGTGWSPLIILALPLLFILFLLFFLRGQRRSAAAVPAVRPERRAGVHQGLRGR
jgi:ATP-dependent Zn protease